MRFQIRQTKLDVELPEKVLELWLEPTARGDGVCLYARTAGDEHSYAWALLYILPEGLQLCPGVGRGLGLPLDAAGRVALKP